MKPSIFDHYSSGPAPLTSLTQPTQIPLAPQDFSKIEMRIKGTQEMNYTFAEKLNTMADKLQPKIDDCFRDRETNTAKRLAQAMSKRLDGVRLQRAQAMMRALAECYRTDTVPHALRIRTPITSALIQTWARGKSTPCSNGYHGYHVDCNEPDSDHQMVLAAWALLKPKTAEQLRLEKIDEVMRSLHGNSIPGFFPTPRAIVQEMVEACGFFKDSTDLKIMDPNGGSGAILDYLREILPGTRFITGEVNHTLRNLLELKGYELSWDDFLAVEPKPLVDYVFMNPPFENLADTQHIMHAYKFLNEDGELSAIMAPSAFHNSNKKAQQFREWFEAVGGEKVKDIPAGAFKESGTNVSTILIKVIKHG